jgi:hypothetical protein
MSQSPAARVTAIFSQLSSVNRCRNGSSSMSTWSPGSNTRAWSRPANPAERKTLSVSVLGDRRRFERVEG